MYKCLLITMLLFLSGCTFGNVNGIPKGNEGNAKQSESSKERIVGDIEGEIELPETPILDENGIPFPPQKIRIDGVDAELPVGTKGKFKMSASGKSSTDSFSQMASSWKLNSAPVQLFVFGGFMVAAGVVLMFFGLWTLGFGVSLGGSALIACGIMINQYPWVILIVIGVTLLACAYYLYTEYKKKQLFGHNQDVNFVLEALTNVVSTLPDDVLETYIKKPLREHDDSSLIKTITMKARAKV